MCDTVVNVQSNKVFFAKNSDRDVNEPQLIEWYPARKASRQRLKCTYVEIDDDSDCYAIMISRPSWLWGAEMGTNEHGVCIGNEAVFTRHKVPAFGLTGMDLLRLALERAATAKLAVEAIVELIGRYGQGGCGSKNNSSFKYFSSFLIADASEAYVLETTANDYAVEHIRQGTRSISNGLTISEFSNKYSDYLYTKVNACRIRQVRSHQGSENATSILDYMRALRDHGEGRIQPHYKFINGAMDSICMHAGGFLAGSQTTASWVSELSLQKRQHWVTGTAAPCTSLFKPVAVEYPLIQISGKPFSPLAYWRGHELVHKAIISDWSIAAEFFSKRNSFEELWTQTLPNTEDAFGFGLALDHEFLGSLKNRKLRDSRPWYVRRYWSAFKDFV